MEKKWVEPGNVEEEKGGSLCPVDETEEDRIFSTIK